MLVFQAGAAAAFGALRAWLMSTFDWVFMGASNLFVLFCLLLMATPLGRVRLGGADARPNYSRATWFAMLFAAGIGIGLMFFGVSEPVEHLLRPPLGLEAADPAAARLGMASTIYHWGIHGWAIYAVVAVSIAFASYNLGLPMTLRSAFYPLMGEAVWGRFGHGLDILAVFATLFGLATSLGLGAQQLAAGLAHLWGTPTTDTTQVLLIAGITGMALTSVVSGMEKGVKRLSEANLLLALLLLVFVLTIGPTFDIALGVVTSLGQYFAVIGPLSNWVGREDLDFMHGWTTFFWAWWISWSPFVGLFVARVSRGRTVRELIACMLIIPTLLIALWMNAFGGTCGIAVRRPWASRRDRGGAGAATGDRPVRAAGDAAAGERHVGHRPRAHRGVLCHLLRLRIAGDRHHHRRRQAGRAGRPARVLVRLRRAGRHRAAARRRSRGRAGGHPRRRPSLRAGAGRPVLQHLEGATRDTNRPGQVTRHRPVCGAMSCRGPVTIRHTGGRAWHARHARARLPTDVVPRIRRMLFRR